jgi:hypothetical protein
MSAAEVAPSVPLSAAVELLLGEMEKVEQAAEALAQSEPEAAPVLGDSARGSLPDMPRSTASSSTYCRTHYRPQHLNPSRRLPMLMNRTTVCPR